MDEVYGTTTSGEAMTTPSDDFTRRVAEILCVIYYGDDYSEENDDWIADWLPVAREAIQMQAEALEEAAKEFRDERWPGIGTWRHPSQLVDLCADHLEARARALREGK